MDIVTRELSFDGPNGHVFGELYLPASFDASADAPLGCIVCSHGFNSTHVSPARYGRRLVEAEPGYCAYAFDFCGGGEGSKSDGSMLEMSILTELADLLAALDVVRALPEVDVSRIVLEGHSQGGFVSALAAAEGPDDIAGLMLLYPAFMIPAAVRRMAPSRDEIPDRGVALGVAIGGCYAADAWDVDAFGAAAAYPGPALIIQGSDDPIVPAEDSRHAASLYAQGELIELEGESHGFSEEGQEMAFEAMLDFLTGTLGVGG